MGSNPLSANIPFYIMSLIDNIRQVCSRSFLLEDSSPLVIACSAGPDSTALCHILAMLCCEQNIQFALAHVNYHLRGEESEQDRDFVLSLSEHYNVPLYESSIEGKSHCPAGESLQAYFRHVRFSFFQTLLDSGRAGKVALGHNLDDTIETFFLRLFRGAGLSGLKGIKLEEKGLFIRPFIFTSREEIISFLDEQGLAYREDSSNVSLRYDRNLLRHRVIPFIKAELDIPLERMMERTLEILRTEDDYMGEEVTKVMYSTGFLIDKRKNRLVFDRGIFLDCHKALQRRILLTLLYELEEVVIPRSNFFGHIEELIKSIANHQGSKIYSLNQQVSVIVEDSKVTIEETQQPLTGLSRRLLKVPGTESFDLLNLRIVAEIIPSENHKSKIEHIGVEKDEVFFDADKISSPELLIRPRKAGDRFQPFGFMGSKSLKKFFIEAKIPVFRRSQVLLVCCGEEILWIVGYRRAAAAPITESTRRILHLRLEEIEEIEEIEKNPFVGYEK